VRTPIGRAILSDAMGVALEEYDSKINPEFSDQAMAKVLDWSMRKKKKASEQRHTLQQ